MEHASAEECTNWELSITSTVLPVTELYVLFLYPSAKTLAYVSYLSTITEQLITQVLVSLAVKVLASELL